jgi:glycosyltransferase involved in cell wall biosynthesis
MDRVRVLHVITRLIVGGAQENTLITASELNKSAEWDAAVVCGPQTGPEGSLIESAEARGIPLTIEPALVRELNPFRDLGALVRLARLIRRGKFTIVHTHSSKAGILGRWAARLAGAPVIVHTVHGWGFHERQHPALSRLFIYLEKLTLGITDRLIVVSRLDIEKGLEVGIGEPGDYVMIRSGIELDRFGHPLVPGEETRAILGIPAGAPVVGTVTRLSAQKSPLDFVRAASRVAAEMPEAHFLMVGDGPLKSDVDKLVRELGISNRVIMTGLRRDVPELLAAMDIFVLTSLWEGLPRVLPQAMAAGLPIVATSVDGNVEAIRHGANGLLTPPGEPDSLAAAVLSLFADKELARKLAAAGKERVQEYGDRLMVDHIAELYQELMEQKEAATRLE